jgi:hypothetical protein
MSTTSSSPFRSRAVLGSKGEKVRCNCRLRCIARGVEFQSGCALFGGTIRQQRDERLGERCC